MNLDRWFGVASFLVSLLLGYFLYRKQVRPKLLALAYSTPLPMMIPMPEVAVTYAGARRQELVRVFVLFWSRGSAPIEESDFIKPIETRGDHPIIGMKLIDKDPMANVDINPQNNSLSIKLLRPGEACILQIDVAAETYRPDLLVHMKSTDMSREISARRAKYPHLIGTLVGAVPFLFSMLLLPSYLTLFMTTDPTTNGIILIGVMVGGAVLSVLLGWFVETISKKLLLDSISQVAARFFRSETLISNIAAYWVGIRSGFVHLFRSS